MKLLALAASGLVLGTLTLLPPRALAQTNEQVQAANKTQTAIARTKANLANAIAQGRVTLTPTPLPATPTPRPTEASAAAQAELSTDSPTDTPTAFPALVASTGDSQPQAGYIRPSTTDAAWLELAVAEGRWDFLSDTPACGPLGAWSNVWLVPGGGQPLLVGRDGVHEGATCGVLETLWHSDVPCAMTDGECDVLGDAAYWAALVDATPSTATADAAPSQSSAEVASSMATADVAPSRPSDEVAPSVAPADAAPSPAADVLPSEPPPSAPPAVTSVAASGPVSSPPAQQVRIVVQTVVVVVTAVPSNTRTADALASRGSLLAATTPTPRPPVLAGQPSTATQPALARQVTPRSAPEVGGVQSGAANRAAARSAATNPVAAVTPVEQVQTSGLPAWVVVTMGLTAGLAVCGAIAIVSLRNGLLASHIELIAALVAAIGIILVVILILAVMFVGSLDQYG